MLSRATGGEDEEAEAEEAEARARASEEVKRDSVTKQEQMRNCIDRDVDRLGTCLFPINVRVIRRHFFCAEEDNNLIKRETAVLCKCAPSPTEKLKETTERTPNPLKR